MAPQYPQNPNYAVGLPTSTMAIVSLVAGILGLSLFPLLGSIIAIVTGMSARAETRGPAITATGDGLATAGIIMGWIGVALGVLSLCVICVAFLPLLGTFLFAASGG